MTTKTTYVHGPTLPKAEIDCLTFVKTGPTARGIEPTQAAGPPVSMLRRSHDYHREVPARLLAAHPRAAAPPRSGSTHHDQITLDATSNCCTSAGPAIGCSPSRCSRQSPCRSISATQLRCCPLQSTAIREATSAILHIPPLPPILSPLFGIRLSGGNRNSSTESKPRRPLRVAEFREFSMVFGAEIGEPPRPRSRTSVQNAVRLLGCREHDEASPIL
jgi:hypothetical protein